MSVTFHNIILEETTMNDDTVKLLKECSSGICMAKDAINEILEDVKNDDLREILKASITKHDSLQDETNQYLKAFHEDAEKPSILAKGMAHLKSNMKLAADHSDATVADLITDGCNMGIKSLHRYLNQYPAADKDIKKLTKDIINAESSLREQLCAYL